MRRIIQMNLVEADLPWLLGAYPAVERALAETGREVNGSNVLKLAVMLAGNLLEGTKIPWMKDDT